MPSVKRLSSVCHSIAHHAVSGLSYIHPHLRKALRDSNLDVMEIDLLNDEPCPKGFLNNEPLRLSLGELQKKFISILASEGLSLAVLSNAKLEFSPDKKYTDDHCTICRSILTSTSGRTYDRTINCLGQAVRA